MAIPSEGAGPPVEWAGRPVSPTLPYLRVSNVCLMPPGALLVYNYINNLLNFTQVFNIVISLSQVYFSLTRVCVSNCFIVTVMYIYHEQLNLV